MTIIVINICNSNGHPVKCCKQSPVTSVTTSSTTCNGCSQWVDNTSVVMWKSKKWDVGQKSQFFINNLHSILA